MNSKLGYFVIHDTSDNSQSVISSGLRRAGIESGKYPEFVLYKNSYVHSLTIL